MKKSGRNFPSGFFCALSEELFIFSVQENCLENGWKLYIMSEKSFVIGKVLSKNS